VTVHEYIIPHVLVFSLRAVLMGFVVVTVALSRVLHRVLRLCRLSMVPPVIHDQISYAEWQMVPLDAAVSRIRWMVDVIVAIVQTA